MCSKLLTSPVSLASIISCYMNWLTELSKPNSSQSGMIEPEPGNIWDAWADFASYVFQTKYCFRNVNDLWDKQRALLTEPVGNESTRLELLEACGDIKLHLDGFQKHVTELGQLSGKFNRAVVRDIDGSGDGHHPEHERMVDEIRASRESIESRKLPGDLSASMEGIGMIWEFAVYAKGDGFDDG